MVDCDRVVALLMQINDESRQTSVTTYGENTSWQYRRAKFETESVAVNTFGFRTYCEDPTPDIGEIMGIELTRRWGFSITESGTYPNMPEWDYSTRRGDIQSDSSQFWLINTRSGPDFWLPGVNPPSEVTPLSTTRAGFDRSFLAWIGSKKAIDQWVAMNRMILDVTQDFVNFAGGRTVNTTYQYQGYRIACSFPYEALLRYPFCGGVVAGQESKGPQFINLCQNDLGVCSDCCNCCKIGERFLQAFKMPL